MLRCWHLLLLLWSVNVPSTRTHSVFTSDHCSVGSPPSMNVAKVGCPLHKSPWDVFWSRSAPEAHLVDLVTTAQPNNVGLPDLTAFPESPAKLQDKPTVLELDIHVKRISSIDQKEQNFVLEYQTTWSWADCRLLCNCSYIQVTYHQKAFEKIWRPPFQLMQRVTRSLDTEELRQPYQWLRGEGMANYIENHNDIIRCTFDFANMPFDLQTCKMTFYVPGVGNIGTQGIVLSWADTLSGDELKTAEWQIDQPENWKLTTGSRLDPEGDWSVATLDVTFTMKRMPHSLLEHYVLPSMLFYIVSWTGLWISSAAVPARAAMAVIPVLVQTTKMNSLAHHLPPISEATKLQSVMIITLSLMVLHTIEFAFVHYCGVRVTHHAAQRKLRQEARDQERPAGLEPQGADWKAGTVASAEPRFEKLELAVMNFSLKYVEVNMRWMSPLVYLIFCLVKLRE